MAFPKHCDVLATSLSRTRHINPLIAPAATHGRLDKCRTDRPSIPPSAATSMPASRASRAQRNGPSAAAVGWLSVGNAGERNARAAPARRARTNSAPLCAELVTGPRRGRTTQGQRPARRCTPARRDAASDVSRHDQRQAAGAAQPGKVAAKRHPVRRAVVPQHHARQAPRQTGHRRARVRQPVRIGEQPKRRQVAATARDGCSRPGDEPVIHDFVASPIRPRNMRRLGSFPCPSLPALAPLGSPTAAPQQNRHGMAHRASDLLTPPAAPSF